MDILVIDVKKEYAEYHEKEVTDIYQFLKENKVDVVINQWGQLPDFLEYFLDRGGKRWHDEGGRIISCLHFSPIPPSLLYNYQSKRDKSLKNYYVIAKAFLFQKRFAKRDKRIQGDALRKVYDNSDSFVMLSESYRQYIVEAMGVDDDSKLITINNPLTFEGELSEKALDYKKNTILVVGRMYEWHKRIMLVLKMWKILSRKALMQDWTLKIVGDGPDIERYKEYVTKNDLRRVFFEGQQDPKPYYHEAKILWMTSKTEGWGQTITESLQRGVVPVAFDTSTAFHDIISDGENGFLVKEGAMSQFVKKVEQLTNDDKLWRKMAKSALRSANRFSLDKIIQEWERVI